jgi:2-polyprenyl-6-methoxyphenol hydroxylase-like FAD-dependent oxidoreductase
MKTYTIAVAGCGPAGMAAALFLHRQGHDVTVFERFEAPRAVGSGLMLQPTGLQVLQTLGLRDAAVATGASIERLFGRAEPSGRTVLDVRYAALGDRRSFGLGIHRGALFSILHAALCDAAVPIKTARQLKSAPLDPDGRRRLTFEGADEAGPFDLVVDALGSWTPLAPPTGRTLDYGALWTSVGWPQGSGLQTSMLEQRYQAASVMTGVLPVGRRPGESAPQAAFFWSLRHDRLEAWRARGLNPWKEDVERLWPATRPLLTQLQSPEQLTFARYAHRSLSRPAEPALIHIGDAWHSASPQLGQGANMALLDAFALDLALRRRSDLAEALSYAVRLRRHHVRIYQAMTAMFTPVYQSDSKLLPFVRDRLVGPLSRLWPATRIQALMVSGLIGSPLQRLGLAP